MILASGVRTCRFCDFELPKGFWLQGDADLQVEPAAVLSPGKAPTVSVSRLSPLPRTSSQMTPLPDSKVKKLVTSESGSSRLSPLPLGPPTGLSQGSALNRIKKREASGMTQMDFQDQMLSDAVSRLTELPPEAISRVSGLLDPGAGSGEIRPKAKPPNSTGPVLEAFSGRTLAAVAVLLLLGIGSLVLSLKGNRPATVAVECREECAARYQAGEKDGSMVQSKTDFMSACASKCLRPKPKDRAAPAAEQ